SASMPPSKATATIGNAGALFGNSISSQAWSDTWNAATAPTASTTPCRSGDGCSRTPLTAAARVASACTAVLSGAGDVLVKSVSSAGQDAPLALGIVSDA